MPTYSYKGRSKDGQVVSGKLDAATKDSAATELIKRGVVPISIDDAVSTIDWEQLAKIEIIKSPPTREEMSAFCRQLYALYKAGITLSTAISRITLHVRNNMMKEALKQVHVELESGISLGKAFEKHPKVFPKLFCSVISVGEGTGQLEDAFLQLSAYMELEQATVKRMKSVLRYPTIVITAISIAFIIINIFVIPAFSSFFQRFGAELPWATRLLMSTSNFMLAYWPYMLVSFFALFFGFRSYIKTASGRERWHRFQLNLPLIGDILRRILFARYTRLMAMVLRTDILLPVGIELVAEAIGNDHMGKHILKMKADIARGDSLLKSAVNSNMFSPLVLQMIAVGEETGQLEEMFIQVAEFYEREIDYDIKKLSDAIEPILLVVIGAMVLLLALGVFMPMWSMTKVIRTKKKV